mgnify:CR=1 FL=1
MTCEDKLYSIYSNRDEETFRPAQTTQSMQPEFYNFKHSSFGVLPDSANQYLSYPVVEKHQF